ncbi:hypothetical protein [Bacillus sp. 1P06AnD]|uniref:hypothetical protein n=1 Tax=Bacillus sp. 1P06AnD TaxID=3132208 RepID=UPI0039A1A035
MNEYIFDLLLTAVLIIGLTALNGVISNTIGEKLFRSKKRHVHRMASLNTQEGWGLSGGKADRD